MPELPEVEVLRAQLHERLAGRTLDRLEVFDGRLTRPRDPHEVAVLASGRGVGAVRRRGKWLLFALEGGTLVWHLRMTGRMTYVGSDGSFGMRLVASESSAVAGRPTHLRARLHLSDGARVDYTDTRRFGTAEWVPGDAVDLEVHFAGRTGVEPLGGDLDGALLAAAFRGRRAPVKALLLDQRIVAGVGNIYCDEALWQAQIHPLRPSGSIRRPALHRLAEAIIDRLRAGIAAGGASIDSYHDADGAPGRMQELLRVHLHRGDPCPRCGTEIVKLVVAGRGTYVCPRCQPRPRTRASSA
jgi:formamidopyrimidine-DNA glycosylase